MAASPNRSRPATSGRPQPNEYGLGRPFRPARMELSLVSAYMTFPDGTAFIRWTPSHNPVPSQSSPPLPHQGSAASPHHPQHPNRAMKSSHTSLAAKPDSNSCNLLHDPALEDTGLERQPCIVHMQRTVARHCRGMDPETSTHQDRAVLPILVGTSGRRRWRVGCGWHPQCRSCSDTCWRIGTTWRAASGIRPSQPAPTGWRVAGAEPNATRLC